MCRKMGPANSLNDRNLSLFSQTRAPKNATISDPEFIV
jgi:hypothetical protein